MRPETASLDYHLQIAGEDAVLRRMAGSGANAVPVDVAVRVAVRGVGQDQVGGKITQDDLSVVLSPTPILKAQWRAASARGR